VGLEVGPSNNRSAAGPKRFGPWLMGRAGGPKFNGKLVRRQDPATIGPLLDPKGLSLG